jgi:hypothetical protein
MKTSMPSANGQLYRRLAADVAALGLPAGPPAPPVTEADLADLPEAAVRYLNFMGVAGRPPDSSFLAHVTGRFRLRPQLPWMRCEAWQYNTSPTVARLFHMRITAAGVLPMTGRDAYVRGRGRMHGTLAGLVTVAGQARQSRRTAPMLSASRGPAAVPRVRGQPGEGPSARPEAAGSRWRGDKSSTMSLPSSCA